MGNKLALFQWSGASHVDSQIPVNEGIDIRRVKKWEQVI